jgi:hypothetical protein
MSKEQLLKNIFILLGVMLFGCKSDCKFGKPIAIFPNGLPIVTEQHFEARAADAVESILFKNGLRLQITQSGCNDLKQVFEFTQQGNFSGREDAFWKQVAIDQLKMMSSMHVSLQTFGLWAKAIEGILPTLKLGEVTEIEPNTYVKIDKITNGKDAILLLELSKKR